MQFHIDLKEIAARSEREPSSATGRDSISTALVE
jgi:hypothetical protein